MFGSKICLLYFLLVGFGMSVLGCAKPNYQENPPATSPQSQKPGDCSLRFTKTNFCINWSFDTLPTTSAAAAVKVQLDPLADLPEGVSLKLVLWMPDHGHGSSPTSTVRLAPGTYRIQDIYFIMPGNWQLRFQLLKGGVIFDQAVDYVRL